MSKEEMRAILSEHLRHYRSWSYTQLAERIERDRVNHDCLDHIEGTAPDGREYQVELQAFWDGAVNGNIRVVADLSAEPQKRVFGFLPIYASDLVASFVITPEGAFLDE